MYKALSEVGGRSRVLSLWEGTEGREGAENPIQTTCRTVEDEHVSHGLFTVQYITMFKIDVQSHVDLKSI